MLNGLVTGNRSAGGGDGGDATLLQSDVAAVLLEVDVGGAGKVVDAERVVLSQCGRRHGGQHACKDEGC